MTEPQPRRTAALFVLAVALVVAIAFGGSVYLRSLNDPAAAADTTVTAADTKPVEADPVGTCFDLVADDRPDASPGARHWAVTRCSAAHVSEVFAHLERPAGISENTSDWDSDDLAELVDACAELLPETEAVAFTGEDPVISASPRAGTLMCVATTPAHRHTRGERVDVDA